jgi:hypothetical protein
MNTFSQLTKSRFGGKRYVSTTCTNTAQEWRYRRHRFFTVTASTALAGAEVGTVVHLLQG